MLRAGQEGLLGSKRRTGQLVLRTALSSPEGRLPPAQPLCTCSAAFLEDAPERNGPLQPKHQSKMHTGPAQTLRKIQETALSSKGERKDTFKGE